MATTTTRKKTATKSAAPRSAAPRKKKAASRSKSGTPTEPMLREFFIESLKDIYWAEKKLVTALPKMQKAATSEELKNAIGEHVDVTREHVSRLEEVFELMETKAQGKKCEAMEGLIKEGESVIEDTEEGTSTRDVALIISAQKVEHYEIAAYGGLTQLAKTLGLQDVADLLGTTLEEEKQADENLTGIAENDINYQAKEEDEEEGEEGSDDTEEDEEE